MKKLIVIMFSISLISACSSLKINTPKAKFTEVRFGNYGGFTNISTEYVITADGQLLKVENGSSKPIKQLQKQLIRKIGGKLKSIDFEHLKINEPGNITYFIKVKTTEYENIVRWNDETKNTELLNTYKMLTEILN